MKIRTRHEKILDLLNREQDVDVEDLASRFALTTQTIRNDLRALSSQGLVQRTHGGVRRVDSVTNRDYAERRAHLQAEKKAIGAVVAALLPNECSLALNIGTTTEHVARALRSHSGLVVVSNNINVINLLMSAKIKELVMVGGAVRQSDGAIVGQDAVDFISRYKVDFAVIGASAVDADGAILDYDAREVSVARAILKNSRTRILVADSSKFERTAPVRICDIGDVDYFVTDATPPQAFLDAAMKAQTEVLTAEVHDDQAL